MITKIALTIFSWAAIGQAEYSGREPVFRDGTQMSAPVKVEDHQQNTGGSDGAGLCVIASITMAGRSLGIEEVESLWEQAKKEPGGYWPEKFDKLVKRVCPDLRYAHVVGADYETLKRLSDEGIGFGITMDTGELYGYKSIEHMVYGGHFDDRLACFIDNNNPGFYTWVSKDEWKRRSTMNRGEFWALILSPPDAAAPSAQAIGALLGLGVVCALTMAPKPKEEEVFHA